MAKKKAKATKRSTRPAAKKKAAKVVRKPLKTKKKAAKAKARPAAKTTRKPARKVTRTPVARKAVKKVAKKAVRKAAKKVVAAPKTAKRAVKKTARKPVKKVVTQARKPAPKAVLPVPARLQRERKRLPEVELEEFSGEGSDERLLSSARTGHDELRSELRLHTEASPELTAGDVDAKWQDAYAVGDETPGGDNMTPDHDRVDDIGKAMGVVYDDDEELMGGDEINARDQHRWELDPASKEDDDEI
jgi:hypothetical protein